MDTSLLQYFTESVCLHRYGGNAASGMTLSDAVSPEGSSHGEEEVVPAPPSTPTVLVESPTTERVNEPMSCTVEETKEGEGGEYIDCY